MAVFDPNDPSIYASLFGLPQPQTPQTVMPAGNYTPFAPGEEQVVLPASVPENLAGMSMEELIAHPGDAEQTPMVSTALGPAAPIDLADVGLTPPQAPGELGVPLDTPQPGLAPGERVSRSEGVSISTPILVQKKHGRLDYDQGEAAAAAVGRAQPFEEAAQQRQRALRAELEANQAITAQAAADKQAISDFDKQTAEENKQFEAIANQAATERITGITNAIEAVRSMKVDPTRIWNQGGGAQKAAGLAAAFIGGFLQPVLGQNTIQQTIDRAIDRDIDAQKTDMQTAQQNVANLRMLHSLGLKQAETEAEQRAQDRLLRKASLVGQLEATAMQLQDPILKAKYDGAVAQMNEDLARTVDTMFVQERDRLHKELMDRRDRELKSQQVAIQRRAGRRAEAALKLKARQMELDAQRAEEAKQLPITTGFSVNGQRLTIQDDTERRKVRQASQGLNNQYAGVEALKNIDYGRLKIPDSEERLMANAIISDVLQNNGESIARSSDKDMQFFLNRLGGDPDKLFRLADQERINNVLDAFQGAIKRNGTFMARAYDENAIWQPDPSVTKAYVTEVAGGEEEARATGISRLVKEMEGQSDNEGKLAKAQDIYNKVESGVIPLTLGKENRHIKEAQEVLGGLDPAVRRKLRPQVEEIQQKQARGERLSAKEVKLVNRWNRWGIPREERTILEEQGGRLVEVDIMDKFNEMTEMGSTAFKKRELREAKKRERAERAAERKAQDQQFEDYMRGRDVLGRPIK